MSKYIGRIAKISGERSRLRAAGDEVRVPGKRTRSEQIQQPSPPATAPRSPRAPVQAQGELGGDRAHDWAAHGVRSASAPLPHGDRIQALFGHHDVGGVRASVGGPAAEASSALGARAYASGDAVAFAQPPDLQLAAHEAAHVVQQRGGVRLSDGLGRAGDAYEQHADAVAAAVVRGDSAEALLDPMAHRGAGGGPAVQRAAGPAPQAPAAPAPSASRTVHGQGGYTYDQRADGTITVVAGPHSVGKTYPAGDPVNQAITAEIGAFPAAAAAPTPAPETAAPPAPSAAPSTAPSLLERAESGFSDFVGWLGSLMPGSDEPPAEEDGPCEEPVFGQEPDSSEPSSAELDELMSQDRLTPEQIARARELISGLAPEQQKPLLLALQDKAAYLNQRDNLSSKETADGGTCNFTSVAMVLEYLGVSNPDPTRQFEDVLVEKAGTGNIKSPDTWEKVALEFGVTMKYLFQAPTGEGMTIARAQWETVRDGHLGAGEGVVMSLRGHIVRLQGMNDAGLIVDDPYGASTLAEDKRIERNGETERYSWKSGGLNSTDGGVGGNKGEDLGYPWKDVETYRFKYVVAFNR